MRSIYSLVIALAAAPAAAEQCTSDIDGFNRHFAAAYHEMQEYQALARMCEPHIGGGVAVTNVWQMEQFLRAAGYNPINAASAANDADLRARAYASKRGLSLSGPGLSDTEMQIACIEEMDARHDRFGEERKLMMEAGCR